MTLIHNHPKSHGDPTLDRNVPMDSRLHQRMCNLPTKQNPHSLNKDTPLLHYDKRRNPPLPTNHNGPYHGSSAASWTQCHTNHSRPWMLMRSNLPSML